MSFRASSFLLFPFLSPKANTLFPPPSLPPYVLYPPTSSTLPQVSLPHSAGGLMGVKACIHHSPLPLPRSWLGAKEPPWKESSLSLPLPPNWREQRNKLFPSPCSPLPRAPTRICSRASCLAVCRLGQGLEQNKPPPTSSPDLTVPKITIPHCSWAPGEGVQIPRLRLTG